MSQKYYGSSYQSIPQKRFSLWLPVVLYDRITMDSVQYGVHKSHIVKQALIAYYRSIDNGTANIIPEPSR